MHMINIIKKLIYFLIQLAVPQIIKYILIDFIYQKQKHLNMAQVTDSRVQFFNSQSSFGSSSSVSYSRIEFANDQLLSDTEEIFSTLQQILIPRQDLVDKIQLNHLIHRARILSKQTIPEHIHRLNKNNKSQLNKINIKCQQKLTKLIADYNLYSNSRMSYEDFYNLYGRQKKNQKDFSKKKQVSSLEICNNIQPDIVNIIESGPPKPLQYMPRSSGIDIQKYCQQDKQIKKLQDQLQISKKRQKNQIEHYEQLYRQLKKQTNLRIYNILTIHKNNNNPQIVNKLKQQIQKLQKQLNAQYQKQQKLTIQISQLQQTLQQINNKNRILQNQLNTYRKNNSSRLSGNKSNQDTFFDKDNNQRIRKMQKQNKNLEYQNNLLKNQLKKQRQFVYRQKKVHINVQESQINNLNKALEIKKYQLRQAHHESDKYKVQSIKLIDQLQKSQKSAQLAKFQANNLPFLISSRYDLDSSNNGGNNFYRQNKDMAKLDESRATRYSIGTYIGDGNQHYPYYQLLNKEFKVRFRRSCLKDKQLLYKANGLQVGLISQFVKPNQIKLNLHISNFCDQQIIKNLSLKTINSKNNKIILKNSQYASLQIGQQIKTGLTVYIKNIPIGCTVLLCQYDYYDKHEQVRILLPIHIFKMLVFTPRDDQFRSSNKVTVQTQRKVFKDMNTLVGYFKGAKVQNNVIKSTIFHEQTQTKLLCDIIYRNNEIAIQYQYRSGQQNLCEYIVKTLAFLLKKQENM